MVEFVWELKFLCFCLSFPWVKLEYWSLSCWWPPEPKGPDPGCHPVGPPVPCPVGGPWVLPWWGVCESPRSLHDGGRSRCGPHDVTLMLKIDLDQVAIFHQEDDRELCVHFLRQNKDCCERQKGANCAHGKFTSKIRLEKFDLN